MPFSDRLHDSAQAQRLIDSMGLQFKQQPRDMVLPVLGLFGAGLVVGAALGLLFAPKPGTEIRNELQSQLRRVRRSHDGEAVPPNGHPKANNPYAG